LLDNLIRFGFETSNNQVEYEALIAGLKLAKDLRVRCLRCQTDSQLVSGQMNGEYQAREPLLQKYHNMTKELALQFEDISIVHVPRGDNARADILSKLASTRKTGQHRMLIQEVLSIPSLDRDYVFDVWVGRKGWMTPILNFLMNDMLPDDRTEARRIRRQAASYTVVGGELFRRGFSSLLLKCLDQEQVDYVLSELHKGICGMHSGARAMAVRVLRVGYY